MNRRMALGAPTCKQREQPVRVSRSTLYSRQGEGARSGEAPIRWRRGWRWGDMRRWQLSRRQPRRANSQSRRTTIESRRTVSHACMRSVIIQSVAVCRIQICRSQSLAHTRNALSRLVYHTPAVGHAQTNPVYTLTRSPYLLP